jgi:hypothetical protein
VTVSISLVVLLGVSVWLMHRYAGLKLMQALVCFLFGFFLAATGSAPLIRHLVLTVIAALSGHR